MVIVVCAITTASLASVTLSQTNQRLHKHFHAWLILFASVLCPIMASVSYSIHLETGYKINTHLHLGTTMDTHANGGILARLN